MQTKKSTQSTKSKSSKTSSKKRGNAKKKSTTKRTTATEPAPRLERLQKVIARAGIASRRAAEELIRAGLVSVNGHVVTELGTKVDPTRDHVKVEGRPLRPPERFLYYALYKPQRVVTTLNDPKRRRTVKDLLVRARIRERVYPIGRLDYDTEGLILLTNDGDLAAHCMHPRHGVPKVYKVLVEGDFSDALVEKLESGVVIAGRPGKPARRTAPARVRRLRMMRRPKMRTMIEITLREGRNRQVRRMLERVGRDVVYLCRTAVGPVSLGTMQVGDLRELTRREIEALRKL